MADELFPSEAIASESPRLRWMKAHDVHTLDSRIQPEPWSAWVGELTAAIAVGGDNPEIGGYAVGETEDDAICALAKARGWRLWNECEVSP